MQCSPYQEAVWPEEAVLCHCSQSCDNEEDAKRSDRWTNRAVEPEAGRLVGLTHRDVVIGTHEIRIPVESQTGSSFRIPVRLTI